ncbi:hypothetical protein [Sphingomonas yantingensis]|uniref:Uncharacterized membrane protein YcjF (UPF0283 family) n=1 Tax=Sphingomonas yantingensis TaxID=1241761 RepID=A0A7W9AMF2_9SPHN|nr:hypothetical protein [Sphingomonas yantingensis]MBB5697028.1 uncharacterized membrane protein YcjF (UPF0283 family) [Sphingomonas yantingensis]
MTEQAFAALGLLGSTAVGAVAIVGLARQLIRHGWTVHGGLGLMLTGTGTLAVVATVGGIA